MNVPFSLTNERPGDAELGRIRQSIIRGRPFGDDKWVKQIVKKWNLQHTLRPRGRPKKSPVKR